MFRVRGILALCVSGVSSKQIHTDPQVVHGHGLAAPPPGHHHPHPPRQPIRVRAISQFDTPGGFHPEPNPYTGLELGPSTEQVFVSGPPLGDDFLIQYQQLLNTAQSNPKLTFNSLMFGPLVEKKQKRNPQPAIEAAIPSKPQVTLEYNSAPIQDSEQTENFRPNGKWYGAKETQLLKYTGPTVKSKSVELQFASPNVGSFTPNGRWYGDRARGLLTYPNYIAPNRAAIILTDPAPADGKESFSPNGHWFGEKEENLATVNVRPGYVSQDPLESPSTKELSGGSFSPSEWLEYRERVIETGTRPGVQDLYQGEPAVITLDNIAQFQGLQARPDVFNVNVQAVVRTRGAHSTEGLV